MRFGRVGQEGEGEACDEAGARVGGARVGARPQAASREEEQACDQPRVCDQQIEDGQAFL